MFDYTGKVVVISGASSGLGAQMAKAYAAQGADLALLARRVDRLEALAEEFKAMGRKCIAIKCDVTDSKMVDEAAAAAEKAFGRVDVLVNNAGSAKNGGVLSMTDEDWQFTIDTDLTSLFYMTRAFANLMKKNNYGRIINIASMYGLIGNTAIETVA
ncbi:MAG: SDR family oxidoreductase, partial [Oscillospiraceae bacterium]|nr:SDR family oxidoreductase [Oscillospiraceae bacterium]